MRKPSARCLSAIAVLAAFAVAPAAHAAPADEVKALLEGGKPAEAYRVGKERPEQLGNPSFDFFFGVAAIDAGHAGEGVLALERYLLNYPDNRSGRFQLARGYFIVGEDQRARDEFEVLLADAEGAEKAAIERFMDGIRARESQYQPTASAWVEGGMGWDSNINSGLGGTQVNIAGTSIDIDPASTSLKTRDRFYTLGGGVQGNYPIAPGVALFGSVAADARLYGKRENNIFETGNIGAQGGVSLLDGRHLYRFFASYGDLRTDDQAFLTQTGVGADYQYQPDDANRYNLGLGLATLDFADTMVFATRTQAAPTLSINTVRNSDLATASGGWTHLFQHAMQPTLFVGLSYATETNGGHSQGTPNTDALRAQHTRDVASLRSSLSFVPKDRWGASIGYQYQDSRYHGPWAGAQQNRRDRYDALDLSLSYFVDKNLVVRGELLFAKQVSPSASLFTYERNAVALKARYEFK